MIHAFKELLDALDTPGGHIFASIFIGLMGVGLAIYGVMSGHEKLAEVSTILTGFFQIAAYAMRGTAKANGQGREPNGK